MGSVNKWCVVFINDYKDHSIKLAISFTPSCDIDVEVEAIDMLLERSGLDVSGWILWSADIQPNNENGAN